MGFQSINSYTHLHFFYLLPFVILYCYQLRQVESREASPEVALYHELSAGLASTSDAVPSADAAAAADAVVDDEGYFHLPEPPELGSSLPPDTSLLAPDGDQRRPLTNSCLEAENVCVNADKSDTTVNFQLAVPVFNLACVFSASSSSSLFGMHHQCVAPLAANSPHGDLSRAISIASSKVRLCRDRSFFRVAIQE